MKPILTILLITFFFVACSQKPNNVVAVKIGDEHYATDRYAAEALANNNSKDKVICKNIMKTGSRMKTRVCSTKSQMELERKEDQQRINDAIQNTANQRTLNNRGG